MLANGRWDLIGRLKSKSNTHYHHHYRYHHHRHHHHHHHRHQGTNTKCHCINPLQTKRGLLYLKTQFVPHCKHFSSRL
jgi:hypothetical protein